MSIVTSLCSAARITVGVVEFRKFRSVSGGDRVYAIQSIIVHMADGPEVELRIHLDEGCTALAAGETVVLPSPDEVAE
ncbi:hypothetical protein HI806_02255 [Ralstonia solanacearum]|uniref:hypothetical protein n=1 Tax=Ralstonia pseudosolanacearum TaxID=1310165 RepID=UPI0005782F9C|nr:hypothetical protein [Ralstonia pseudosolanacearum]APF85675.1 hypothetical protein BCR16_02115 [Ralstonia solanacearum FJAT-1458]AZU57885.1 hypothetical protein CFM90_17835 [Ralstonia solanacearum]QKL70180.1 hypothetical protein HI806_02255 [Ralstonia solanacearum]QKL75393.1 hypothetical protein HI805_02260 [Ralstonia solanacearum]QKL80594.1 hypothetical protein HI804_02265 [Ralstonia solanacearum]